jgi:tRNA-dihydrouridine synthase 1
MAMPTQPNKLHGRAFYESIGSPKMILAPMVDRSEFAWRMLSRSYLPQEQSKNLLAYTPMLHARLFKDGAKFRDEHFQPKKSSLISTEPTPEEPWLDGNPTIDRPLFVQFCANKPEEFLAAAEYVAPYCDAVDLNLGCPQGIARSGHYGAFLQEDWDTIRNLISKLHKDLSVPITAKMRVLETREKTLEYAKMILSAGASLLTVHGRRREQKGHNTGLADLTILRYLRENLPKETVLFANGNILNHGDIQASLEATGFDGVMSAEGNLSDPTIFAEPPADPESRDYWRGSDGIGGYRIDGVVRRYFDIIHRYVLETEPPQRPQLYLPGDDTPEPQLPERPSDQSQPKSKKRKRDKRPDSPSLRPMQGHLFHMLRAVVSTHTDIRDALAQTRAGDMEGFERVLLMLEKAIRKALDEEAARTPEEREAAKAAAEEAAKKASDFEKSVARYRRPWWVCQPFIRQSPEEAMAKGALKAKQKDLAKDEQQNANKRQKKADVMTDGVDKVAGIDEGIVREQRPDVVDQVEQTPKAAVVCG